MGRTLIAIDAGTTGVSCQLYTAELELIARAYREFPQRFPRPGWVEHDSADILAAVDATLAEILALPEAADAAAIGIANQRETVFALDPGFGQAVRPGIVWQDRRTAERCAELRAQGVEPLVRERTGLVLDPYFSASKIEWILRDDPDLQERAAGGGLVFCTVDTLIVQHLTEQAVIATEPTNASRTMLFDIDKRAWDPELCALFGVQRDWLPELRPSIGDFGRSSRYLVGREIPIRGVAGDQQAALYGQGCVEAGELKITFGTGCFLLLNTGARRVSSKRGFLCTLALGADGGSCYALEGAVFVGGAAIQFLRDQFGFLREAGESEALARAVPDSGGVVFVPAFTGLGAPYWDADARGAILGLTRGTRREHVLRAALEAIAFQNAELIELLRTETGLPIARVRVDGGAAANALLLQLQADFAQTEIVRSSELAATGRGAAALAGVGAGLFQRPPAPAAAGSASFRAALSAAEADARMAGWRAAVARVRSA